MCLSAALVVPPGADAGWGVGFDSQAAQARLADFLLDELLVGGCGCWCWWRFLGAAAGCCLLFCKLMSGSISP